MPNPAVYRRKDGSLYLKLNEEWHLKTKFSPERKTWQGDGPTEKLNPNEEVEVIEK